MVVLDEHTEELRRAEAGRQLRQAARARLTHSCGGPRQAAVFHSEAAPLSLCRLDLCDEHTGAGRRV